MLYSFLTVWFMFTFILGMILLMPILLINNKLDSDLFLIICLIFIIVISLVITYLYLKDDIKKHKSYNQEKIKMRT